MIITNNHNSNKKVAKVYYQSELVQTIDLSNKKLQVYEINASNGLVKIEVKDGKVRVVQENSPRHLCRIQGWSDSTLKPIVCLPNHLFIKIEDYQEAELDVLI